MRIKVKLYASLSRFAPEGQIAGVPFEMDVTEGASLQDGADALNLPSDEVKITFVNGRAQEMDWRLNEGDDIGYFPPVGGGAQ